MAFVFVSFIRAEVGTGIFVCRGYNVIVTKFTGPHHKISEYYGTKQLNVP